MLGILAQILLAIFIRIVWPEKSRASFAEWFKNLNLSWFEGIGIALIVFFLAPALLVSFVVPSDGFWFTADPHAIWDCLKTGCYR